MKNYLRYGLIAFLVIGCYDNNILSPKMNETVDLGVVSTSTKFRTQRVTTTDGHASILVEVTSGALYSLQLTSIDGKVLAVQGFTADKVNQVIDLDYTKIKNGSYDLNLLDVSGNIVKIPVTINKQ
jgi:hypothetical protein